MAGITTANAWLQAKRAQLTLNNVIGDLAVVESDGTEFNTASNLSADNELRVRWLHENDAFNLPDEHRPSCHRDKAHTYGSVYGRMYGNEPSPTLSTGFLSLGRGRFVRPTLPRTLTPHEGARIQGFPDDFRFQGQSGQVPGRTQKAKLIGDAVPPPLVFHVALAALTMARID